MKKIDIYTVKLIKEKSGLYDVESTKISSPMDAYKIIQSVLDLESESVEKLGILALNTKNVVCGVHIISVGSLNSSIVHPREVFKNAILNNANSIMLFHNHPSGDTTPSQEDISVTGRLREAGTILGINVLDHIIIGEYGKYCSLKESSLGGL